MNPLALPSLFYQLVLDDDAYFPSAILLPHSCPNDHCSTRQYNCHLYYPYHMPNVVMSPAVDCLVSFLGMVQFLHPMASGLCNIFELDVSKGPHVHSACD